MIPGPLSYRVFRETDPWPSNCHAMRCSQVREFLSSESVALCDREAMTGLTEAPADTSFIESYF